jgi:acyl-CoA thioesterase-1
MTAVMRRCLAVAAIALALLLDATGWSTTVVCLGDSLTAGLGLSEEQAYPALVEGLAKADRRDWRVVNAGVSGDTTAGGLRRVAWALKAKPDLVLVELGGNDGLRGLSLEQTRANLRSIIERIQAEHVAVCVVGMRLPTNYGETYRDGFARVFPEVATATGAPLLPFLLEGVAGKPELNQPDGIHPTADGQRLVARTVYRFLVERLEPKAEEPAKPKE